MDPIEESEHEIPEMSMVESGLKAKEPTAASRQKSAAATFN
jgi:hypothetical protein